MKKLILALPLLFVALLLSTSCNRSSPYSQVWQIKEGSIHDGDTLGVVKDSEELKIRLCGIDAPELKQQMGIASRDYLRSLVAKGDGRIFVTPIEKDRYGRTVAELSVPIKGKDDDIFLNGEMVRAGYAWHYQRYSGDCPNKNALAIAEDIAKESKAGVWKDPNSQPPWEFRKQH